MPEHLSNTYPVNTMPPPEASGGPSLQEQEGLACPRRDWPWPFSLPRHRMSSPSGRSWCHRYSGLWIS